MLNTVYLLPVVTILGPILLFLMVIPVNTAPFASTASPQQLYQAYLDSLSGTQELGTTRAPHKKLPHFEEGSFEAALKAGMFLIHIKFSFITVFIVC